MDKIILENEKYEITHNPLTHWFECKRYGEKWLTIKPEDMNGGKMFIGMFYEMIKMKEDIKDAINLANTFEHDWNQEDQTRLVELMKKHRK